MSINTYTLVESEIYDDAVEIVFYHGRSDYKAHLRLSKMEGVDGGVSFDDLTVNQNGTPAIAFIPPSVIVEALELLGCDVPEDSYYRACHMASGHTSNMCRDTGNMCDSCPQKEATEKLPPTLFACHRRIAQLEQAYDMLYAEFEKKEGVYDKPVDEEEADVNTRMDTYEMAFTDGEEHVLRDLLATARYMELTASLASIVDEAGYSFDFMEEDAPTLSSNKTLPEKLHDLQYPNCPATKDNQLPRPSDIGKAEILDTVALIVQRLEEFAMETSIALVDSVNTEGFEHESKAMARTVTVVQSLADELWERKQAIIDGTLMDLGLVHTGERLSDYTQTGDLLHELRTEGAGEHPLP